MNYMVSKYIFRPFYFIYFSNGKLAYQRLTQNPLIENSNNISISFNETFPEHLIQIMGEAKNIKHLLNFSRNLRLINAHLPKTLSIQLNYSLTNEVCRVTMFLILSISLLYL